MKQVHLHAACALFCLTMALSFPVPAADQLPPGADTSANATANASAKTPASAPHSAIPYKQEKQTTDTLAYQSFAALVLVGLAAYGIVFGLKRFGGLSGGLPGKGRRARLIEATKLGRRSMLYVVEYQGQELLLAEGEHGVQLLMSGPLSTRPATPGQAADQGASHA